MTDVAYGNPEALSATQDMSSQERLEGFVSTVASPCSDASFGSTFQNPVINDVDPTSGIEVSALGSLIPESVILSGESTAGQSEVILLAEKRKDSHGADDFNATLSIRYQYLRDIRDRSTEESVLDAPDIEILPPVDVPAVKISDLENTTAKPSALESSSVGTSAIDNLILDAPVIRSTNQTQPLNVSTVEIRAMEFSIPADAKEETAFGSECSHFQDEVQDVVPGVIRLGLEAKDVIVKDKWADAVVGVEQQPLSGPFENEGQSVTSAAITVMETPLITIEDACQISPSEMRAVQNGESRMDEEVPAVNYAVSLSTTGVCRVEINTTTEDTTGRPVKDTAGKTTEDNGDKLVDEMSDRMVNKLANGMADRMADAIAEEIADQIADRMADEIVDKMADEMADEMVDGIADAINDRTAYKMGDKMADEMTDRVADEMADMMVDEMADRMADEMAAEVADELASESGHRRDEENQDTERLDDGETREVVGGEEMGDDGYEDDEGSPAEQMAFVEVLERFFKQRNLEYKAPKFYGLELNVLKLWRVVSRYGGYDHVTVSKLWRTVGEEFKPPKTCTTISWSFRGFYEKALLEYERLKTGLSAPDSCQRTVQTIGCYLTNDQRTASPATPSSDPNMGGTRRSGSGRARRDAASRAMQGWHSQRMGNGDAKETTSKVMKERDKSSGGKHVKKERKLTNLGGNGLKRKGTKTVLERAVKAVQARGRPRLHEVSPPSNSAVTGKRSMKQQDPGKRPVKVAKVDGPVGGFDPPIVDEGPKADWVKINVHKHLDCFEIYALVPGLAREEVRIQCEPGGRLVIAGMPEDPENPWGVTPFRKVICLPARIDAHQTSAVVTLYGQLYVRVPIAEDKSS